MGCCCNVLLTSLLVQSVQGGRELRADDGSVREALLRLYVLNTVYDV